MHYTHHYLAHTQSARKGTAASVGVYCSFGRKRAHTEAVVNPSNQPYRKSEGQRSFQSINKVCQVIAEIEMIHAYQEKGKGKEGETNRKIQFVTTKDIMPHCPACPNLADTNIRIRNLHIPNSRQQRQSEHASGTS